MQANDRAIAGLTMTGHALVHTYELSIPILMTVWLEEFGVSKALLGGAVSVGYALLGIGALPSGVLVDRLGSKRPIIACLTGMSAAFLLLSIAQGVFFIAGALAVWGLAASIYHPAGLALISKGAVKRGSVFAYHGIAGNLGIALGPLVTTVLLLFFDWRTVSAFLALPAFGAISLAWRLQIEEEAATPGAPESTHAAQESAAFSWRDFWHSSRHLFASTFLIVFVLVMLNGLYYRGILTFLPDLLERLAGVDPITLGNLTLEPSRYVYVGLLLVGVGGQYAGGYLTDRYSVERGILGALIILTVTALGYLPLARLGFAWLLGASAVLGFFLFGMQPLTQAAVAEYTPAEARGLSYGYNYLGVFGIGALGAALAGALLDAFNAQVMFTVLAGIEALGAVAAVVLVRRYASKRMTA